RYFAVCDFHVPLRVQSGLYEFSISGAEEQGGCVQNLFGESRPIANATREMKVASYGNVWRQFDLPRLDERNPPSAGRKCGYAARLGESAVFGATFFDK